MRITIETEPYEFWETLQTIGRGFGEVLTKAAADAVEKQRRRKR